MRVTQGMLSNNMLRNLSNSYDSLGKYMDQLSTGKKINRPSDDPVVAMKGMNYRTQVTEIEQYQRNTSEVHNWMDNSDSALDQATQALQRLRELAVQGSNGTYEEGQRENIAQEVDQLRDHLADIANTKVNGKYIFNGTKTDTPPVIDGVVQEGGGDVVVEVASGTKLKANIDAGEVFSSDLFDDIQAFSDALRSDIPDGELDANIASLDNHIDNVVNERADLGARMNRLDLIEDRLSSQEVTANKMMSDNEDIDLEKVIMKLTTQESVHRAALSAGSRIIQPTLTDFLR
ncbi:flagellar hook-associated protein FlgL [Sediminibacillus halophilus]|uniref:Flagellar hook-associated protein 3 FlgL n=1 Tax=Sediminibacillus halophilus TaxID=482461 RepID=A0A1G9RCT4_9BACI|nr:flagellar hook-associated protein FlgL [Sediminibacillus halophilus]SDM20971.1 flagellar hook-associated protein 3 FlgL [Sediminibacillus halophilus]